MRYHELKGPGRGLFQACAPVIRHVKNMIIMTIDCLFEIRSTYLRYIILDNYILNNLLFIYNTVVIPTKCTLVK